MRRSGRNGPLSYVGIRIVCRRWEAFAWLAIQGNILIGERWKKYSFIGPTKCVLRGNYSEDVYHLLAQRIAKECWDDLKSRLGLVGPLPNRIFDIFKCWPIKVSKTSLSKLWVISPSIVI